MCANNDNIQLILSLPLDTPQYLQNSIQLGWAMNIFDGIGWFWIVSFAVISGFLYQIVLELKGIRRQLEVFIKLKFPHIFDKD
jgi:hypothetical protein